VIERAGPFTHAKNDPQIQLMRRECRRLAFAPRLKGGVVGRTHYINDNAPFVTTKYYGRGFGGVSARALRN
jgi:hypothetical protein